jgi:hypothetical protein
MEFFKINLKKCYVLLSKWIFTKTIIYNQSISYKFTIVNKKD